MDFTFLFVTLYFSEGFCVLGASYQGRPSRYHPLPGPERTRRGQYQAHTKAPAHGRGGRKTGLSQHSNLFSFWFLGRRSVTRRISFCDSLIFVQISRFLSLSSEIIQAVKLDIICFPSGVKRARVRFLPHCFSDPLGWQKIQIPSEGSKQLSGCLMLLTL